MRSMSSSDRRPFSAVIVIFSALPVPLSSADTWRMPFASISKVTSIWGTPRGAGGMPVSSNLPSLRANEPVSRVLVDGVKVAPMSRTPHVYRWLSFVIERSPSKT